MSIESVMPSNRLILCHRLHLPSAFPSIRVFPNVLAPHLRWPKYWSLSFSISLSNEYSGLISFTIDWFDLAVQGILMSLLQHHSSKASILRCSAFFIFLELSFLWACATHCSSGFSPLRSPYLLNWTITSLKAGRTYS